VPDGITEEIAAVPFHSSPIEIALDAEDEHVPLIVGPNLAAAEKACTARESVASASERIAPGGTAGTPANLTADIEAGPGIDRRRRGGDGCHWRPGKRQIGGGRGSGPGSDRGGKTKTARERRHRRATPRRSGRTRRDVSNTAPAHAKPKKPKLFGQSVISRWLENDFEFLA
jgi:hypothetical protein